MKRVFALLLFLLMAPAAQAQTAAVTACTEPTTGLGRQMWVGSCSDQENRDAIEAQAQANRDLVNGAHSQILSGNRRSMLDGLGTLQRYLERSEATFREFPGDTCSGVGEVRKWPARPCNPLPLIQRGIERDFAAQGWPIPASTSAGYGWMIAELNNPASEFANGISGYARRQPVELLPHELLAREEQARRYEMRLASAETEQQQYDRAREERGTVIGNLTSAPDRLWAVVKGWFALGLGLLIFTHFVARRAFVGAGMAGWAQTMWSLMIAMIPMGAFYVMFGGFLDRLPGGGMFSTLVMLLVTVAVVVVVKVRFPWAKVAAWPVTRVLPGWGGIRTLHPVQASSSIGSGTHGSASFSETREAIAKGHYQAQGSVLADSHGFALGRGNLTPETAAELRGMDPRFRFMGHVLTCAPTGSGKGIGAVIPTLLDYPGSAIVIDIKGENYAVTGRYRREKLGHDVYVVDPFGVTGVPSHGFNWLDRLDPDSPDVVSEANALADMLVLVEGSASDGSSHFNDTAKDLLAGLMIHVACTDNPARRNMGEVRRLLTASEDEFVELLTDMAMSERGQNIPARVANAITSTPEKERGSILSTARRHTAFLDDPRIVDALARSDFRLADLKAKPMTVYVVLPPTALAANKRFMRGFIGQALSAVTSSSAKPAYKVVFLLDEFAQLGRMQAVEDAISLVRGYGAAFWLFVQDLSQLKGVYPKWQTFLANSAKQFFGTADFDTAKFISDSLGKRTVEFHTEGSSASTGGKGSSGSSDSQQFTGRELLTPDEVMRLPPDRPLVFINGEAPHVLQRLNYLTDPEYQGLYDHNPYH